MKFFHPKKHLRIAKQKIHDWFLYYLLPDSVYLKIRYKQVFGKKLNLKNPQTFNEKIQWLKLHDRNPLYHKLVDKYEAKKIIGQIIGEEYIIKTLGIWDNYEDIDFSTLPNQFILKCNHDAASITICTDKSKFKPSEHAWRYDTVFMKRDYYHYENKQWAYKDITPKIIAEQYLQDDKYSSLSDYKIWCINGSAKCINVMLNRFTDITAKMYDMQWNPMPFDFDHPATKMYIEKPQNLDLMKELAEKIARFVNNPYVRVDFYEVKGRVYFGEVTFYPAGGTSFFTPPEWDGIIGSWIDLSKGAE